MFIKLNIYLRKSKLTILKNDFSRAFKYKKEFPKFFQVLENSFSIPKTGIEGNSGSDGKGKWNKMVWACVEEG